MSVMNCLMNRRVGLMSSALGFLLTIAVSCARDDSNLNSKPTSIGAGGNEADFFGLEKISFEQWCTRWGLICPKPEPKSFATETQTSLSKDEQKWRAIAELTDKAFKSGSNFTIEQQELNSARIRIFMNQLGWGDVHGDVLDVLNKSGLRKLVLEPTGQLRFEARTTLNGQSGTVRGNSGMKWAFANEGEVSVGALGQYIFKGLEFSAATSFESDEFGQLHFNESDKTLWSGNALAVTHIPDGFFIKDIPVRWEKFNDVKRDVLVRNATEARNIIFSPNRIVRLNSSFFDTAAKHSELFVEDDKIKTAVRQLINAFGQMEMKAPSTSNPLAQVSLQQAGSVVCRIEMSGTPAIDVTLDKLFGIQNVFTNEKRNAQIDLYGINIKARVGIPISFNLRRVDIEPTRIVIKGIPVVGEISIPLPGSDKKLGKELKKLECSER
ncbi:MAG: hypothetical protein FJY29_03015 [Betaproteobacteria bacterium]|nr:hypothetical protein [Betaproteobacteria bacterium]